MNHEIDIFYRIILLLVLWLLIVYRARHSCLTMAHILAFLVKQT